MDIYTVEFVRLSKFAPALVTEEDQNSLIPARYKTTYQPVTRQLQQYDKFREVRIKISTTNLRKNRRRMSEDKTNMPKTQTVRDDYYGEGTILGSKYGM